LCQILPLLAAAGIANGQGRSATAPDPLLAVPLVRAEPEAVAAENAMRLVLAAKLGRVEAVTLILARGADVQARDPEGVTPLYAACREGQAAVADLLLSTGADPRATVRGLAPLHAAAAAGRADIAASLLEAGAPPDPVSPAGATPLHVAARYGRAGAASILLRAGADPDARGLRAMTPLHVAARHGQSEAAAALIENGARPDPAMEDGRTPLHLSILHGPPGLTRRLAEAVGRAPAPYGDLPALHFAVEFGDAAQLAALLAGGLDPDARDAAEQTALHRAVWSGDSRAVAISKPPCISPRGSDGWRRRRGWRVTAPTCRGTPPGGGRRPKKRAARDTTAWRAFSRRRA